MTWIWQRTAWPKMVWRNAEIASLLAPARHAQGRLLGRMEAIGVPFRAEAFLQTLTQDAVRTSEIEGEILNAQEVRSSIARRIGIDAGALRPADRNVEGIADVIVDATHNFGHPLTAERLFGWHAALFPTGYSGMARIRVGNWRDDSGGPMQVAFGPVGRERVHYAAPPAERLADEIDAFLRWFNSDTGIDPVLQAGLAHFWFVTIHPFDDGNGRIARAIADLVLTRSENSAQRFYSMSAQISAERGRYYRTLESVQRGGLDITPWMRWFLACFGRAIDGTAKTLSSVLDKARFWDARNGMSLNQRQVMMINRLLNGFEGKLTSSKWATLAKCSQDTANRDIADLRQRDILRKGKAGGRSTHYELVLP